MGWGGGYKTQPSEQSRASLVAYRRSDLSSGSRCEYSLQAASNPSPTNMVLEDSDVEMIVAEIEVSVSRWLQCAVDFIGFGGLWRLRCPFQPSESSLKWKEKDLLLFICRYCLDMVGRLLFSAPTGARCGDSLWKDPLHHEGGPQERQTHHPDHARHRPEP